ncbi:MAG: hypothetical protein ACJ8F1_22640 [Polyangia bacterium]
MGGAGGTPGFVEVTFADKINNNLDLLFVIKNSSSVGAMQAKFVNQLPTFMQVLQKLPNGLPNLHVAVVSTDMGVPGDSTSMLGCRTLGDDGQFQSQPRQGCASTTLSSGSTFVSDVDGQTNFTDPIEKVLQCISPLGSSGCGFVHPLAAIDRALGANGAPPPDSNAGFLRADAYLGIVILTDEDDCSAPANTTLYSLNGGPQSITNPLGPVAKYRCNQFGHVCKDPSGAPVMPPLNPSSAAGTPPMLNLTDCTSNDTDSALLTPVSTFVRDIKGLKTDPDNQIFVAAITAPPDPYTVEWVPPSAGTPAGELWPQVMLSCGARGGDDTSPMATQFTTDGTSGRPGVRISQFALAFPNSIVGSVCDPSYGSAMTAIATKLGGLIRGPCVAGRIQVGSSGQPACTVTNHVRDDSGRTTDVAVQSCAVNGNQAPCWTLEADTAKCPTGGFSFKLMTDAAAQAATSLTTTVKCSLCQPGSTMPGC